jgi:hypothetical protein
MMSERGIALAHMTILRWVQRYVPVFEKQWSHYARPVGGSWRCDETYKGERPLDVPVLSSGQTGSNGGLPAERTTRCCGGQALFPQSDEEPPDTARHHPGRLRSIASGHYRTEVSGNHAASRSNTIQ